MAGPTARTGLEIAIIGMACRLPGASDPEAYWRNLRDGIWSVRTFTEAELLAAGVERRVFEAPGYVRANAVVDDADRFDAEYFDIAPREAELIDPQHRVFLECCADALSAAGYDATRQPFLTGVYAGANANTYALGLQSDLAGTESTANLQALLGNDKDYLATRVSYKLNLRGPSVTVQTACSTSLVAVHLACRALLGGECDLALAGGVSIRVPQQAGYQYQEGGIHSPDGRCRAFDARAQGTTFGSGAGVVVLKRLDQAIADRDHVHAIILGSAINNDGAAKVGYTAPGLAGQRDVIRAAHQIAGIDPRSIGYVEAHATATPLGDPIELQALTESFRAQTADRQFCAIGAVKSNVGHLVTAAGIAGLIKTVLALTHEAIPPTLHFEQPNPHLELDASPFFVNTMLRPWPRGATPRRAGVSSFGVGGTNAHVVLEEAPLPAPPAGASAPARRPYQLIPISARSEAARDRLTERLAASLETESAPKAAPALRDVAWTLQVGRRPLPVRRAIIVRTMEELREELREALRGGADRRARIDGRDPGGSRPVMLLFPGQGLQHAGMARELWDTEPLFRAEVDRCCDLLRPHVGLDLRTLLFPAAGDEPRAAEQLNQTAYTQAALFIVEYALARQLMAWGVTPHSLIGHSIGEYVAAAIAGVFTREDALSLVAARGRLMQELPRGAMTAVALPESELTPLLDDGIALACVNGPRAMVAGGMPQAVEAFEQRLRAHGVQTHRLRTSHAFHSPMLDPMLPRFLDRLQRVALQPPRIPFVSNLTGSWITAEQATSPAYWVRHARETVRFHEGLETLLREPEAMLVEVGPGQALTMMAGAHPAAGAGHRFVQTMAGASDRRSDEQLLLQAVGTLWTGGVAIDWDAFAAVEQGGRIPLPGYPFERQRYWFSEPPSRRATAEEVRDAARGAWRTGDEGDADDADGTNGTDAAGAAVERGIVLSVPAWRQAAIGTAIAHGVGSASAGAANDAAGATTGIADIADRAQTADRGDVAPVGTRSAWLMFVEDSPLGDALVSGVRAMGQQVLRVLPGARSIGLTASDAAATPSAARVAHTADDRDASGMLDDCVLDPADAAGYAALLQRVSRSGVALTHVLHAWTAAAAATAAADDAGVHAGHEAHLERGFHSLLLLAQAVGRDASREPLALTVVTSDLFDIAGETRPNPERATLAGACAVIPLEYPHVRCRLIDVRPPDDGGRAGGAAQVVEQILTECRSASDASVVAYRRHDRWIRSWRPLDLAAAPTPTSLLRADGVYLVTGAFGRLGLEVAERLSERAPGVRLVLVGRQAPPEPDGWERWMAEGGESPRNPVSGVEDGRGDHAGSGTRTGAAARAAIVRRLQRMRDRGTALLTISADVTDAAQTRAAVQRAVDRFGTIHGVIHAAGVLSTDLVQTKTAAGAAGVLAPKVRGTRVLAEAVAYLDVEFLALFSSSLAITGAVGQIDYCAANAFLDAFARQAAATGGPRTLSIAWDGWRAEPTRDAADDVTHDGTHDKASDTREAPSAPETKETQEVQTPREQKAGAALEVTRAPAGRDSHAPAAGEGAPRDGAFRPPLMSYRIAPTGHAARFVTEIDADRDWVAAEHLVGGAPTLVGTAFVEMARAAAVAEAGTDAVSIEHLFFLAPLTLRSGTRVRLRTVLDRDEDGWEVRIESDDTRNDSGHAAGDDNGSGNSNGNGNDNGDGHADAGRGDGGGRDGGDISERGRRAFAPTEYARGRVRAAGPASPVPAVAELLARCTRPVAAHDLRAAARSTTHAAPGAHAADMANAAHAAKASLTGPLVQWGPRWNSVRSIHAGEREALIVLDLPEPFVADLDTMTLHPALLDVATAMMAMVAGLDDYIPISYGRVSVHGPLTRTIYSHARRRGAADGRQTAAFDLTIYDSGQRPVVRIDDFVMVHESRLRSAPAQATGDRINTSFSSSTRSSADTSARSIAGTHNGGAHTRTGIAGVPAQPGGASSARATGAASRRVQDEIEPADALDIFMRLLSTDTPPQVVVAAEPIGRRLARLRQQQEAARRTDAIEARPAPAGHRYARPSLATPYVEPSGPIEPRVAEIWQEALGIDRVGAEDNFFELGGHSLLAAQIIDRLRRVFGLEISLSTVLEGPTVARTAQFLDEAREAREESLRQTILERLASLSEDDAAAELRRHSA